MNNTTGLHKELQYENRDVYIRRDTATCGRWRPPPGCSGRGVLALLYFVKELLRPGDLNALTLPLVALVAGIAAVFNP